MPKYFAYGSNMNRDRLIDRVGAVEVIGVGALRGYRHLFNKRGRDGTAKGNVEPSEEGRVYGVVYDISPDQLAILDEHEGDYNRAEFSVDVAGALLDAIGYRSRLIAADLLPTPEYLGHYIAGARQHDLPVDYLQSILPDWFAWQ